MPYQIRSNSFTFYRLFFVALFLLMGFVGLGTVVLENYTGIEIIMADSDVEKQAIEATLTVMGLLGFFVAGVVVYLMQERRYHDLDRRRHDRSIDRPDRRRADDRRLIES